MLDISDDISKRLLLGNIRMLELSDVTCFVGECRLGLEESMGDGLCVSYGICVFQKI